MPEFEYEYQYKDEQVVEKQQEKEPEIIADYQTAYEYGAEESPTETHTRSAHESNTISAADYQLNLASDLTEHLFSEEEKQHSYDFHRGHEMEGIFQADVEFDISRFKSMVADCIKDGAHFPCIYTGGEVPIPIDYNSVYWVDPAQRSAIPHNIYRPEYDHLLRNIFSEPEKVQVMPIDPLNVIEIFKYHLKRFLAVRIRGKESGPEKDASTYPYGIPPQRAALPPINVVPFRVVTSTHGLRVHYSRAYFINQALVFGSRTSPVDGYLHPGRYIFGVAGPSIHGVKFSKAEFDVPELRQADLWEL